MGQMLRRLKARNKTKWIGNRKQCEKEKKKRGKNSILVEGVETIVGKSEAMKR